MALRKSTDYLIIHCSATRPSQDVGVKEIDGWHRAEGYLGIGYHAVIRRNGTIEYGRDALEIGAHAKPWNSISYGICLVGGVSEENVRKAEDNFTPAQMEALKGLLTKLRASYPQAEIIGHRDVPDVRKDCPSFDVKRWAKENGF